jgi:hypothetical protein
LIFSPWQGNNPITVRVMILLFIFCASLFSTSAYSQATLPRVVLTYSSRSLASIDLFIAQEHGFFREQGLDPQLVQVRAPVPSIAAV